MNTPSRPRLTFRPLMLQYFSSTIFLGILLAAAPLSAPAQNPVQDLGSGEDSFINTFARPGEPTMTVYLWGTVGRTGIWQIGRDTDLIQFLSAAQVPGIGQEQMDVRQRISLRVFRGGSGDRREVYSQRLNDILEEGAAYPDLQNGDVLLVETSQRRRIFSFQFISTIVGTASSLALLVLRLTRGR